MVTLSAKEQESLSKKILIGLTLRKSHIRFILSWSREVDEDNLPSELVFLFLIFKDNGKLPTRELSDSSCQLHVIKPEMVRKNVHWIYYSLKIYMALFALCLHILQPATNTEHLIVVLFWRQKCWDSSQRNSIFERRVKIFPLPLKQRWIFYFCTDHSPFKKLNEGPEWSENWH